ncbi:hypothetical protein GcC1_043021 [Golovinomyces cichoracearum]|uniref:Uncharacterized protein n=1 Tax=Golovinomyces cichoracearum TaxID=62708 RepID=A0A420IZ22_9PEZI|nr:hypothetical protein GcM3_065033 [Golovinomyces cichoracearum]RKF79765.1 hypothetical protein GcC1_043021 [Golovinomyces cichoracearum]
MPNEGRRISSSFLMMKMTENPLTRLVRSSSPKSFSHHGSRDSGFSQSIDFKDNAIKSSSSSCLSAEDRSFSSDSLNRSAEIVPSTNVNRTINAIMCRQPSVLNMEIERQRFGHDLQVLEPRPIVYWGSFEETLGHL